MKGFLKFLKSLVTDGEWDGDLTKVLGLAIVIAGLVGWLVYDRDPTMVLAFGSGLVATGKFSKQG